MRTQPVRLFVCTLTMSVAALVASCGGRSYGSSPASPTPVSGTADLTITITGMNGAQSFSPNPASVRVGQTVAWRNADSLTHTATSAGTGFDTGNVGAGATSTPVMMGTAGSFDYRCRIHPGMTGTVNVTP